MRRGWEDVVARVHGIAGHLLRRDQLLELGRARDLAQLAVALSDLYPPTVGLGEASSAEELEVAIRRVAAARLAVLARWSVDRLPLLTPMFLDEDRRSVRALLRGAAAGAPAAERLSALIPTPELPFRALEELARQQSVAGAAALLAAWNHPFGAPLLEQTRAPKPDLLRIDVLLTAAHIARSMETVRRTPRADAARRDLIAYVREMADLENASTALQLASHPANIEPSTFFVREGEHLDLRTFVRAATQPEQRAAATILARAFRDTPLAAVFSRDTGGTFEDATLASQLRRVTDAARRFPLGVAPIIAFVVRLRAEARNLRRIVWSIASGAPPITADSLVAPI